MKKKIVKWVSVVLRVLWIAFLLDQTWDIALATKRAYRSWLGNLSNVQERLYEAISMYFAYVQMLVLVIALLIFAIWGLIRMFLKRPGRILGLLRRKALASAIGFACLFVLLFLLDRVVVTRILNTVETNEYLAALHDYQLHGKLEISAELAAIGAVALFSSWRRGRKEEKRARTEPSSVSSGSQ